MVLSPYANHGSSMKNALICVFVLCALAMPAQERKSPSKLKMPGPATQNLLLGTWSIRVEYRSMPGTPKGVGVGEESWRIGPGGASLIEDYRETNSQQSITGMGILWWDSDAGGNRVLWCESTSSPGCKLLNGLGNWEGEQLVIKATEIIDGKPVVLREVFSEITTDRFKQELFSGPNEQSLVRLLTIRGKRKGF